MAVSRAGISRPQTLLSAALAGVPAAQPKIRAGAPFTKSGSAYLDMEVDDALQMSEQTEL